MTPLSWCTSSPRIGDYQFADCKQTRGRVLTAADVEKYRRDLKEHKKTGGCIFCNPEKESKLSDSFKALLQS